MVCDEELPDILDTVRPTELVSALDVESATDSVSDLDFVLLWDEPLDQELLLEPPPEWVVLLLLV